MNETNNKKGVLLFGIGMFILGIISTIFFFNNYDQNLVATTTECSTATDKLKIEQEADQKTIEEEYLNVIASFYNLAELYKAQDNYEQAFLLYEWILDIYEKFSGEDNTDVVIGSYFYMDINHVAKFAKLEKAKLLYERILAICKKTFCREYSDITSSIYDLAELYQTQGNYTQAKSLYEMVLATNKANYGDDCYFEFTDIIARLGRLYEIQKNYDQAFLQYEKALYYSENIHICVNDGGYVNESEIERPHFFIIAMHNNLARLYKIQGKYEQAKQLYEQALLISEEEEIDSMIAMGHNNLAGLYEAQGQYDRAKPLYEQAIEMANKFKFPGAELYTKNYERLLSKMKNK